MTTTTHTAPRYIRRRSIALALFAIMTLAVTITIAATAGSDQPQAATSAITPPASAAPTTPGDQLRALADSITAVPADAHPGPYFYIHTQQWARVSTDVARRETQQWRHRNGSARIIERQLPDRGDLTKLPNGEDRAQLAAAPPTVENYGPGRLPPAVQEPISTDTTGLEEQLYTISPRENGPSSIIVGIVSLNDYHYLGREQRAAILRVLATIPAITYEPNAMDIADHKGILVSLDLGQSTKRLTFNQQTGELLAYQETFNTDPPGLFEYRLYLKHDRTTAFAK